MKYEFTFMSYFNFLYPYGTYEKKENVTFQDIKEVCDYINDKQRG